MVHFCTVDSYSTGSVGCNLIFLGTSSFSTATLVCRKATTWLSQLNQIDLFDDILVEITKVKLALNVEVDQKEIYWSQRTWANWMQFWDRNISFYLKFATKQKHVNSVTSLVGDDGQVDTIMEELLEVFTQYFLGFFTISNSCGFQHLLSVIAGYVSPSMNVAMVLNFMSQDIQYAIYSMSPLKSAGKNVFLALFYQKYWHIINDDVTDFCLRVLYREIPNSDLIPPISFFS